MELEKNITEKELKEKKDLAAKSLEEKRLAIQEKIQVPIHAFQIVDKQLNPVDLFFKEPERMTGAKILSFYEVGNVAMAQQLIMETCFLEAESDPRISQKQVPLELVSEYNSLYYTTLLMTAHLLKTYYSYSSLEVKKK